MVQARGRPGRQAGSTAAEGSPEHRYRRARWARVRAAPERERERGSVCRRLREGREGQGLRHHVRYGGIDADVSDV